MGMDHGTTAVSFEIIDENKEEVTYIQLNRNKLSRKEVSFKDTLQEKVDINKIKLLAMTYAMGDAITKITPLGQVKNRGIQ